MIAEDTASAPFQAAAHYRQAVDALRPYGAGPLLPIALALQGGLVGRRDARRGLRIIAAASAIRARAGGEFAPLFRERVDEGRSVAEAALGAEAPAVRAEGARLTLDEAIGLAFGKAMARPPRPEGLTTRESEIVQRVIAMRTANGRSFIAMATTRRQARAPRRRPMVEQQRGAFIAVPAAGEAIDSPGGSLTFLASGEQTGGAVSAWESSAAPGHGPPFHLHVREDEVMYVREGHMRFRLEEAVHEAPAGSFVFIPRGVPHTWQNGGKTPARLIFAFTPAAAGMERFFERAAALPADRRTAVAFRDFADDAGMVVLGPPLAQSHPASAVEGELPVRTDDRLAVRRPREHVWER